LFRSVVGPAEAFQETGHGQVERCILLIGCGLGADDRALDVAGDLHPLALLDLPRVGLAREHHIGAGDSGGQLRDLVELLLQVAAEAVSDLLLPASHGDFHRTLLELKNSAEPWAVSALYPSGTTSSGRFPRRLSQLARPPTAVAIRRWGLPMSRH